MKANYHTHTYRCLHATDIEDQQYVIQAINAGFDVLAFTDHVPYPKIKYQEDQQGRMLYSQYDEYLASITSLRERYRSKIMILTGFEIEYYPEYLDYYKWLKTQVDVLVLGQHYRFPLAHDYGIYNNDNDVLVYAEQICEAIYAGVPNVLAHPDYFMLGRSKWTTSCIKASEMICETASRHNIPLEINLNGLRYGKKLIDNKEAYPYPYLPFWQIAERYGCKVIYGYDAHDPLTLSQTWRIDEVNKILKGLNLDHIDTIGG